MHSDLDALDNFLERNESEPKWDIEDCKKAYLDNAKEYDRLMKKEEKDE